jgi:hypothetical protein
MSDKIEEIRERHRKRSEIDQSGCYRLDGFTFMGSLAQSQEDVATLLAEVERHRAEIERLRAEMLDLAEWCETEEPLSYKQLSYRLRAALEGKP